MGKLLWFELARGLSYRGVELSGVDCNASIHVTTIMSIRSLCTSEDGHKHQHGNKMNLHSFDILLFMIWLCQGLPHERRCLLHACFPSQRGPGLNRRYNNKEEKCDIKLPWQQNFWTTTIGKAKNTIIFFFTAVWVGFGFHVNLTFALSFVFSMNYRSSVCKLKRS